MSLLLKDTYLHRTCDYYYLLQISLFTVMQEPRKLYSKVKKIKYSSKKVLISRKIIVAFKGVNNLNAAYVSSGKEENLTA